MSRYLTPSKVALLVLINVYLEGSVPSQASIPVLSFMISCLIPSKTTSPAPVPLQEFERRLSSQPSNVPGRSVWDLFLKKLWGIDCADALHAFFDSLDDWYVRPPRHADDPEEEEPPAGEGVAIRLSRTSPLGIFARRAQVEFTRLTFAASALLWKDFITFREPAFSAWRKRNSAAARTSFDESLGGLAAQSIQDIVYGSQDTITAATSSEPRVDGYSTDDIERLLDFQVAEMSKTGHRLPEDARQTLEMMAKSGLMVPSAIHYVHYLDAWKAGDYPAALDNLHRYFDYTIQTREKSHYQFALLNMALLHAHFGYYSEALSAIQETVATARENKDMSCLNYSLSWLYHFGQAHPEEAKEVQKSGVLGSGREALAFLKAKAREHGSWGLLSSSLVAEARLTIVSGDGLAGAVENLVRASHVNLTRRVPAAVAGQMAVEAALWMRLGAHQLSMSKNELFLECYRGACTDQDGVQAVCRNASALAARGLHHEALEAMEAVPAEALRNLRTQAAWSTHMGLIKLQRAIWRDDLFAAEQFARQLAGLVGGDADADAGVQTALLRIRLLAARRDYSGAMELLEATSAGLDGGSGGGGGGGGADVLYRVRLMSLKAGLWHAAGTPQKGFSLALRACSLALAAHVLPALWEALTALARVLSSLAEFAAARDLLVAALPHVLATADRELGAHAYAALADAHVGLAGTAGSGGQRRKEEMAKALEYLDRAFDDFSAIEDVRNQCEMLAKRATIMHVNGDYVLANDIAAKYLDIREKAREEASVCGPYYEKGVSSPGGAG